MSEPGPDTPLPKGWSRGFSNSQQRHYYFHAATKHTQWHFPTASEAADPLKAKRRAEINADQERKRKSGEGLGTIVHNVAKISAEKDDNKVAKRQRTDPDALLALADSTSVAIIVPYRDLHPDQNRAAHLAKFVPHMHDFFGKLLKKGWYQTITSTLWSSQMMAASSIEANYSTLVSTMHERITIMTFSSFTMSIFCPKTILEGGMRNSRKLPSI